jgi:hypothetical protein
VTDTSFDTPSSAQGRSGADDPGYVPGVKHDRYKRYLLPSPGGDPEDLVPWTRVTTLAGMLTSNDGLRIWTEREIMRGVGRRSDLRAMLASGGEDKAVQDEVLKTAKEVAGIGASASWGRALHRAVENWTDPQRSKNGLPAPDPSEDFGRDVIAAVQCLLENGVRIRMVEALVVNPLLSYAGRMDALWEVTLPDGRVVLRVGDVKTGDKLDRKEKRQTMGAQLAAYVNAEYIYDPATRTFTPLPAELDRSTGYILSVRGGVAQLLEIDLVTGWVDVLIAVKLHRRRSASTDMFPVGRPVRIEAPAAQPVSTPGFVEQPESPHEERARIEAQSFDGSAAFQAGADRVTAVVGDYEAHDGPPDCPGDPTHWASAHDPGGAWYGVPLDHGKSINLGPHGDGPDHQIGDRVVVGGVGFTKISDNPFPPPQSQDAPPGTYPGLPLPPRIEGEPASAMLSEPELSPLPGQSESDAVAHADASRREAALLLPGPTVGISAPDPVEGPELVEPERTASGRKKPACSICRKPGHRARNCPDKDKPAGAGAGETASPVIKICPHASGWTRRESDGAWVCVDCGRPSEATTAAMRTGAPLPTVVNPPVDQPLSPLPPVVEGGATVARLDPSPAAAVVAQADNTPPPWATDSTTAVPSLMDRINLVGTKAELESLWNGVATGSAPGEWTDAHTQRAREILPTLR